MLLTPRPTSHLTAGIVSGFDLRSWSRQLCCFCFRSPRRGSSTCSWAFPTILGHAIGLICGYAAFALTAAYMPPFASHGSVHAPRVLAAALSLSPTGALMALLKVSHPPAVATTLIVSL